MRKLSLVAGLGLGAAAAWAASRPSLMPWPKPVRAAVIGLCAVKGAGLGMLVTGGVRVPSARTVAISAGAAAVIGAGGAVAAKKVLAGLAAKGASFDANFTDAPTSALASGGPGSWVDYRTLGREGGRFVHSVATADDIAQVTGKQAVAEPIRVFVGVQSAASVGERVELAIAELKRTGAFDRGTLLIEAPAGTGYSNPTPVEVLETLTLGDVATVAVSYGLLPSFLSLGKVPLAAETQLALLAAIRSELDARAAAGQSRPRLLMYGESLGARVHQAAIPAGFPDMDAFGVDGALWVGTPGGKLADVFHAEVSTSSYKVDRPEQLPDLGDGPRPRVWFLEHDGDPVVHNRPDNMFRRPGWLAPGAERGRNVPPGMTWVPWITWLQVLVDTFFATNVKPGKFESRGHDYRADLGAVVTAAYNLPTSGDIATRLETYLRAAEVARAERLGEIPAS